MDENDDRRLSAGRYSFTVDDASHRVRTDQFLASLKLGRSRSELKRLIEAGRVSVDQKVVAKVGTLVRSGSVVEIELSDPTPTHLVPEAMPIDVRYEDDDVIVLNKAPGVVVHPGAGQRSGTLVHGLLAHAPLSTVGGVLRPGLVHRLDKRTSGLMVVAKSDEAHGALARQLKEHLITKEYLAVCLGKPIPSSGIIDTLHGRDPRNRLRFTTRVKRGKRAVSHYRTVRSWPIASLVAVRIETGRTHQIRVHFSERGHPILGDDLYGSRIQANVLRSWPMLHAAVDEAPGHQLHSARLGFDHPRTAERLEFEVEPPREFSAIIALLEGTRGC